MIESCADAGRLGDITTMHYLEQLDIVVRGL